jgi:hypothetical protein
LMRGSLLTNRVYAQPRDNVKKSYLVVGQFALGNALEVFAKAEGTALRGGGRSMRDCTLLAQASTDGIKMLQINQLTVNLAWSKEFTHLAQRESTRFTQNDTRSKE